MTALRLVDAAAAVPPSAAVAAGYAGVIRYVSQEPSKNLTRQEAAGYLAAHLTVNAIYEDGSSDYLGGEARGTEHGAVAKQLLDAIGHPTDRALVVAVDTDIQPPDYPLGLAYVTAAAAAAGRPGGVYGPDAFVRHCMAKGIRYGMNAAGWRDGVPDAAQIQQGFPEVSVGGVACDPDLATAADYGQWPFEPGPPPAPPFIAATRVAGSAGDAWFLRPHGEVDGRDVAGARVTAYGGLSQETLVKPPISIASTSSGGGYWIAAEDGGVFAFGDARFYGSAATRPLDEPAVAIMATPDGGGYAVVAADGGVFDYGDSRYAGSLAGKRLNAPIVGAAPTVNGAGYWLVAADGGVFAFGDAHFVGAAPAPGGPAPGGAVPGGAGPGAFAPAVGIAACGAGYVVARGDGTVVALGTHFLGDYPHLPPDRREGVRRFVAVAGTPAGDYTLFGNDGTQYHFA